MVTELMSVKWDTFISILLLVLSKPKKIETDLYNKYISMMVSESIEMSPTLVSRLEFPS